MNRSDLIDRMAARMEQLPPKDVDWAVKLMIERLSQTLSEGHRIEIRGFGSFSLRYRAPRTGRNPKTGEDVSLPACYIPHFKPGKELRDLVQAAYLGDVGAAKKGPDKGA